MYTMRQASRRSWRIGQKRPVKVVFMAYRNTLQADVLKLVAKKLQSSLAVEGELPEDGESVEDVFAQARDAEASAEEFLVDYGWKSVEAETIGVNGNGANGNGHHDSIVIDPTVELVVGNGHHEEAPEPQQSLFSWAEFMVDEPVKAKGRGRKSQPAAASLFEWALEREREEEPVGAGR